MMNSARVRSAVTQTVLSLVVMGSITGSAMAQAEASLFEDFVHYTRIAKPDMAAAVAQQLLDSGMSDAELAQLLDGQGHNAVVRFDEASVRAQFIAELEPYASELAERVERGRLDLARDPQRIEEAIRDLTGQLRAQRLAEGRIEAAGEYAVPALLREMVTGNNEVLKTRCRDMLVRIGRVAVRPICASLNDIDQFNQRVLCGVLAEIGYPHAAPFLMELANDTSRPEAVRSAAMDAFKTVGGVNADLSTIYATTGMRYFDESTSLIAYPDEAMSNVWFFDPTVILAPVAVPTTIYCEIEAMRHASRALDLDAGNSMALSLFVASNLRRENELRAEEVDSIFGDLPYSPMFYATVFGTSTCLDVLAMGLDDNDTPLVRDAIAALAQTTGGSNLFAASDSGRKPLVEALLYPDRRTQYEAAIVLGKALPSQGFERDYAVVTTLASAVRTGNRQFAVVMASDQEDINALSAGAEAMGFEVVAGGRNGSEIRAQMDNVIGVDLVLIRAQDEDAARGAVEELRGMAKTTVAPTLIIAEPTDIDPLRREYLADAKVKIASARADGNAMVAAVDDLLHRAAGGRMTEIEAEEFAILALDTLRDIAISGNSVYNLLDAENALIESLELRSGGRRMVVADVLALVNSKASQTALFDAALAAGGNEQASLLDRVAESVRRFGNMSEQRHVNGLLTVIQSSSGNVAESAARVHGSLNLSGNNAVGLIPD